MCVWEYIKGKLRLDWLLINLTISSGQGGKGELDWGGFWLRIVAKEKHALIRSDSLAGDSNCIQFWASAD